MTIRRHLRQIAALGAALALFLPALIRSIRSLQRGEAVEEAMLRDLLGAALVAVIASLLLLIAAKLLRGGQRAHSSTAARSDAMMPPRLLPIACILTILAVVGLASAPAPATLLPLIIAAAVSQLLLVGYALQGVLFAPAPATKPRPPRAKRR